LLSATVKYRTGEWYSGGGYRIPCRIRRKKINALQLPEVSIPALAHNVKAFIFIIFHATLKKRYESSGPLSQTSTHAF
ncbi:MAG: hypothetical protein U1A26_02590, partial [Candidatus Sungbacteria bacterium]|nr:hypothetical protein [Candidatus Sungbacteria bacterium]